MTDRYSTLRNGLVGAWCPSLGATGLRLTDYSPYRRGATISGSPVWGAGAIDLSAASTFAEVPHAEIYNPTPSGFSVSAWFLATTTSLNFADVVVAKAVLTGAQYAFTIQGNGTGIVAFVMANAAQAFFVPQASGIVANRWYHFAGTFDNQNVVAYLNGQVAQSVAFSGTVFTNTAPVRISDHPTAFNRQWPGLIDDVRIYRRCLTRSDVALLSSRRGIGLVPTRHRRGAVIGSQFWLRDTGTWKKATPWINVGGTWKQATPRLSVGGTWK